MVHSLAVDIHQSTIINRNCCPDPLEIGRRFHLAVIEKMSTTNTSEQLEKLSMSPYSVHRTPYNGR